MMRLLVQGLMAHERMQTPLLTHFAPSSIIMDNPGAGVAQLVEQRTRNAQVISSILIASSISFSFFKLRPSRWRDGGIEAACRQRRS
jgi:hypothetical protein